MSGSVWYYAQGESEKGPLTTAQIKALAAAGKIGPDDFVWKQGMESWVPARDVPDLIPKEALAKKLDPPSAEVTPGSLQQTGPDETAVFLGRAGKLLAAGGLLVLLLARGCDSLGIHYVQRLRALTQAEKAQLEVDSRKQLESLREQLETTPETADSTRDELQSHQRQFKQQLQAYEQGPWKTRRLAADAAEAKTHIWAFWRTAAEVVSSLCLATGLLILALAVPATLPERWFALALLAAIVLGLFVGH